MATTTRRKTTKSADLSDVVNTDTICKIDVNDTSENATETIPDNALINVKSNMFGKLIFHSKKTGERIEWAKCGDVQQVTLSTLRAMKLEKLAFFSDQWVIIIGFADDNAHKYKVADIYQQLYIAQYYKNLVDPSDFEAICAMTPAAIKSQIPLMSDGAKANLVVALNTYIEKGVLDSLRAIKAFEEVLGCELRKPD